MHSVKKIRRGVPPSSSMQQSIYCTYCRWGFIERTTTAHSYHRRGHLLVDWVEGKSTVPTPMIYALFLRLKLFSSDQSIIQTFSLTDQSLGFIMFCFYPLTYPRQRAIRRFQFLLTLHFKGQRWQVCLGVSDWWKPTRHITVDDTPAANVTIGHPWTPWTSLT